MDKVGIIIAARTGSSRLPGKALKPLLGLPMIVFLIRRLKSSKHAGNILFATTTLKEDDELTETVKTENVNVFRGENEDVVLRYVTAADEYGFDYVVRITGDCPFVDGSTLDYCLDYCNKLGSFDIATTKGKFPVGIDFEIYNAAEMKKLHNGNNLSCDDREHLTLYMYSNKDKFNVHQIPAPASWKNTKSVYTVDTYEDYNFACELVKNFKSVSLPVKDILDI